MGFVRIGKWIICLWGWNDPLAALQRSQKKHGAENLVMQFCEEPKVVMSASQQEELPV